MMKKLLRSLLVFSILSFCLTAQGQHEQCGHSILKQSMEAQFPGYTDLVNHTFKQAKINVDNSAERMVYTIKTVVHVVWKEDAENIDDQRVYDQIAALNEDYRTLNADFGNLRTEFGDIAADPMIEFELVAIERVETPETFGIDLFAGFDDDKLKVTENGGSTPWDTNEYLNIWVCNIQPLGFGGINLGQILGYAYPPINIADYPEINNWPTDQLAAFQNQAYDGVVIHYDTFGGRDRTITLEGLGTVPMEGRTTAHEVGHYLGLRHIWGDANVLYGEDGCTVDDGIDDTPNMADNSQATGCVDTKNTCMDAADDLPDMWENYMDYAEEPCQVTFSAGQAALMRAVLEGPRFTLIDGVVNTNEQVLSKSLSVSPNPSTGIFQLNLDAVGQDDYVVQVTDLMGRLVTDLTMNTFKNQVELDLSNQANGVYFLIVRSGGLVSSQKIVKGIN